VSLAPGARLGPYEIAGTLGAGGMGEVYRAKDTRLGREVALKIVPTHLSQDSNVRERFDREARAISSLNHPHICTLYDVGRDGDADYFVMELLDGESLAKRLERGPMKPDEALRVGAQIADGLAAAHGHGIVHRDLKPANVVLTKAGAKILDFGVAKLRDEQFTETVTRTTPLTSAGSMVGTVQYMAPEQLEGKPVDHRADLFAFGAVLYEMLTGRRAFDGASQASIIASILKDDPRRLTELAPSLPASVERIVSSCLVKDRDQRWQSAADLARELRWIAEGKSSAVAPVAAVAAPLGTPWRERAAWAFVAMLLAATLFLWMRPQPTVRSLIVAVVPPPGAAISDVSFAENPIAISPDGTRLVMCLHERMGPNELWIRTLATGEIRKLAGTDGAMQPFWSPDGRSIGFFSYRKLRTVNIADGALQALADVRDPRGGTWNSAGKIVFSPSAESPLMSIPAGGGTVEPATHFVGTEATHRFPYFLPDGDHVLYLARAAGAGSRQDVAIWVESSKTHERKKLVEVASSVAYGSGHVVYVKQGVLVAQGFDLARLELRGDPEPLATDVRMDERFSRGQFSVSTEGTLAYCAGAMSRAAILHWIGRDGADLGTIGTPANFFSHGLPTIAPDGRVAMVTILSDAGKADLWRVDLATGMRSRVTIDDDQDHYGAAWSRDGLRLAINGGDAAGHDWIGLIPSDGSGKATHVFESTKTLPYPLSFSPDGRHLLFGFNTPGHEYNRISDLDLSGGNEPVAFSDRPGFEVNPQFSPNGRFVAYTSDGSGRDEVFVAPYPATGKLWQVSQTGGVEPRWSRDGKELFFFDRENRLQAVEVDTSGAAIAIGAVRPLFQSAGEVYLWRYDVAPDGKRFLLTRHVDDGSRASATIVTDWTHKLAETR
jgi:Tol biopolymer transport system component